MADAILFWNEVALEANRLSHTNMPREQAGPVLSSRALAMVHLAMYDAYQAIVPDPAGPYLTTGLPPIPPGTAGHVPTAQAAAGGAAHTILSALFPSQKPFLNAKYAEFGGALVLGPSFGRAVAQALLKDRKDDPGVEDLGYGPGLSFRRHREDPDNPGQGFYAPFYGSRARGIAITQRHGLASPPFGDAEYQAALEEVRRLGIAPELVGTLPPGTPSRTPEETLIGIYWGYDGSVGLGTPPRFYNQIVRQVAIARGQAEDRNARLFALVNAAMADAGILAWEQKYLHDFWRPIVGIREYDRSMGPTAFAASDHLQPGTDPGWLPLGAPASNALNANVLGRVAMAPMMPVISPTDVPHRAPRNFTPNFPAYPSGHATFGAAALHITRLFYGVPAGPAGWKPDAITGGQGFVSDEFNGVTQDVRGTVRPRHVRDFPEGLWQMIIQNGRSRVFLGVHWIFDAFAPISAGNRDPDLNRSVGGVPLGLKIAEDIFASGMKRSNVGPLVNGLPPAPGGPGRLPDSVAGSGLAGPDESGPPPPGSEGEGKRRPRKGR